MRRIFHLEFRFKNIATQITQKYAKNPSVIYESYLSNCLTKFFTKYLTSLSHKLELSDYIPHTNVRRRVTLLLYIRYLKVVNVRLSILYLCYHVLTVIVGSVPTNYLCTRFYLLYHV